MNGHVPPLELDDGDYQKFKTGNVITRGIYAGCIQVGSAYYWVEPNDQVWDLNTGVPGPKQSKITSSVWALCKDGGEYDWDAQNENWEDPETGTPYRWGDNDGTVMMIEV